MGSSQTRASKTEIETQQICQKLMSQTFVIAQKERELKEKAENYKKQALVVYKTGDREKAAMYIGMMNRTSNARKKMLAMQGKLVAIADSIELAQSTTGVISVMREAVDTLSIIMRGVNVEEVDNIMDQFSCLRENLDEVSDKISNGGTTYLEDVTEEEIEAELSKLEREEIDTTFPVAPTTRLTQPDRLLDGLLS